jgi:type IV pilus assembly protein PilA
MIKKKRTERGFTLMELVFVVTIIGILASTALPAYQDYTTRARIAEAIDLSNVARHGVAEYYGRWGTLPSNNAAAGLLAPEAYRGRTVRALEVRDGVVRVVVAPFSSDQARVYALYVRPAVPTQDGMLGALAWSCGATVPEGFKLLGVIGNDRPPDKFLPGSCR